jgi:hypothetical protein
MDAKDFFSHVVVENYKEANADPTNFRKQWNAAISMNTLAEYLALDRAGYPELKRDEVDAKADAVRKQYPVLGELKFHVNTLKHIRSHKGQELFESSTGIMPQDPKTFADLTGVIERAYATTRSDIPECK